MRLLRNFCNVGRFVAYQGLNLVLWDQLVGQAFRFEVRDWCFFAMEVRINQCSMLLLICIACTHLLRAI